MATIMEFEKFSIQFKQIVDEYINKRQSNQEKTEWRKVKILTAFFKNETFNVANWKSCVADIGDILKEQ